MTIDFLSFLMLIVICVCIVHLYMFLSVCMYMWRPEVPLGYFPLSLATLTFERSSLVQLIWSSLISLDCLAKKPQGFTCLHLPSLGITDKSYCAWFLCRCWDWTQILMLVWHKHTNCWLNPLSLVPFVFILWNVYLKSFSLFKIKGYFFLSCRCSLLDI